MKEDYQELLLNAVPLIDVRAPAEFAKGAFPGAVNLPLMDDIERQKVGTCYKKHGQTAALALGHQLVRDQKKADRIAAWAEFARRHPDGRLYCFRGGLRSQIAQQWLRTEAGIDYPRVVGGYKAMRNSLLDAIEDTVARCDFIVLGGLTGSGKTDVLHQLDHSLDLEGYANHRGSSFGGHMSDQPSQIDFEHRLAIAMLRKTTAGYMLFVVEDESRIIGRCALPLSLHRRMQSCPMVWLEDSLENRVQRIIRDFIVSLHAEFRAQYDDETAFAAFAERLRHSLTRLAKRLGSERYQRLVVLMDSALQEQARSGEVGQHEVWIRVLLNDYYDPMYAWQREQNASRVVFSGNQAAMLERLCELCI